MEAKISLPLHMEEQSVFRIISYNIWRYSDTFISRKVLFREMVQSVQSYRVYRYVATSAKYFSVAYTAVDNVGNATLILARRSETILSRRT